MEIRHAVHPDQVELFDTTELREHFLVQNLFVPGALNLVYSHYDRLIVGGACPVEALTLDADPGVIGADYLLERRELGVINIGPPGVVTVDGMRYALGPKDGLYVGRGSRRVSLESVDAHQPARFYLNSAPAHASHPTQAVTPAGTAAVQLGSAEKCNRRTIRKYIHPDGARSCQLVMGMTTLEPGSVWNTMPTHTHPRRIEAYLYFELPPDDLVMHFMGEPRQTRHLVVRDGEAVLSPSWSIHSGVGTCAYTFIWGMAGENQTFTDMDAVPMATLA